MGNKSLLENYIRKHRGYTISFKVNRFILQFYKTFIFSLEHFLSDGLTMRQASISHFLKCDSSNSSGPKTKKSGKL